MTDADQPPGSAGRPPRRPQEISPPPPQGALKPAFAAVAAICFLGLFLAGLILALELNRTDIDRYNIFHYLYARYEPGMLIFLLLLLVVLYAGLVRRSSPLPQLERLLERAAKLPAKRWVAAIAGLVLALCWAGTHWVHHNFPFSQDEYSVAFQSEILAAGRLKAPLLEPWNELGHALTPAFITFDPESRSWFSAYLPVYAALRALFVLLGSPSLLNPLLAALSVLLLARIVRQLWPGRSNELLGAVLLASSSQFLITAMTGYTTPAHLFFNLLWLWLFAGGRRAGLLLAPWVGLLAMGLHAFVPHALFVIPFLLRIVAQRRWKLCAYYAAVYLLASVLWIACLYAINRVFSGTEIAGMARTAGMVWPGRIQLIHFGASLTLLVSWQSLALGVLAVLGLSRWKRLPPVARDLAWGSLITLCFYLFGHHGQGHGWGNRYFHPVLGHLALLAVPGWQVLRHHLGRRPALRFVAVCTLFAALIQLPIRALEVEAMIRPFARAQQYFRSLPEPAVLVHPGMIWYGQDLIRNDPFLADHPKVLALPGLNRAQFERLRARGPVRIVTQRELAALGLFPIAAAPPQPLSGSAKVSAAATDRAKKCQLRAGAGGGARFAVWQESCYIS